MNALLPDIRVLTGDCLDLLRAMSEASVDSIVTDPPYGLTADKKGGSGDASMNVNSPAGRSRVSTGGGFMGLSWDSDVPPVVIWAECLRVLKPGGHLLAFAGTRTQHRMATRIEDAGFEIRDLIAWVYGSGFPKSLDVSKAIDKAAGAEREVVASKFGLPGYRLGPTGANEVYGAGLANGDAKCAITAPATAAARQWDGWGTALKPALEPATVARKPLVGTVAANVLAHGTGALNIAGCRVGMSEDDLRATSRNGVYGETTPGVVGFSKTEMRTPINAAGRWPANLIHDGSDEVVGLFPHSRSGANPTRRGADGGRNAFGDFAGQDSCDAPRGAEEGSAARFFYAAKASRAERGEGNTHPTVKPLALMRYLVRLVTPPGGLVLDPFAGSGTTGLAARAEGMRAILCELSPEYAAIIRRRLADAPPVQGSLL